MTTRVHRPEDLPDFQNPPLVETVLSLQFQPLEGFSLVHVGLLWHKFRDSFPVIEERHPLPVAYEAFGEPSQGQLEVKIEGKPSAPRAWFLNQAQTELIQIQTDRFVHNWRKVGQPSRPYPRYESIRQKFCEEVKELQRFLSDEGLGQILINQCEVTYVNHIEPCHVWRSHGQIDRVLRNWTSLEDGSFLPEAEDRAIQQRYVIVGDSGAPVGRLHASLAPAWGKGGQSPILVLTLTARGRPIGEGIDGAFAFLDLGRTWIVKGFADLTTTEMHQVWRRTDA